MRTEEEIKKRGRYYTEWLYQHAIPQGVIIGTEYWYTIGTLGRE
jgi:hypothetical protein